MEEDPRADPAEAVLEAAVAADIRLREPIRNHDCWLDSFYFFIFYFQSKWQKNSKKSYLTVQKALSGFQNNKISIAKELYSNFVIAGVYITAFCLWYRPQIYAIILLHVKILIWYTLKLFLCLQYPYVP